MRDIIDIIAARIPRIDDSRKIANIAGAPFAVDPALAPGMLACVPVCRRDISRASRGTG